MPKNPLFSVIIPTCNRPDLLPYAIQSVIEQTCKHWELIIINDGHDGPNENVKDIINDFQDPRIQELLKTPKPESGPSVARNMGLRNAQGDFATYLDDDNMYKNNFLEQMKKFIDADANNRLWYCTQQDLQYHNLHNRHDKRVRPIDWGNTERKQFAKLDLENGDSPDTNCIVHRKNIINEGISWDEHLRYLEDWDFVYQIVVKYGDDAIQYCPESLVEIINIDDLETLQKNPENEKLTRRHLINKWRLDPIERIINRQQKYP